MSFAWPQLLGLLVVPLALLIWELRHRRRAASASHPKILRAQASPAAVGMELTAIEVHSKSSHHTGVGVTPAQAAQPVTVMVRVAPVPSRLVGNGAGPLVGP